MAKFVYDEGGETTVVRLEAKQGEEISVEMAAAWAALRQGYALDNIADNIIGLDNAISAVANEIAGK